MMGMSTLDNSQSGFHAEDEDTWDIETDEEEEAEIKDEEQLTMLVRQSYLRHLEKCLKKNYADSANGGEALTPGQMSKMIAFHARRLEKKALRTSMRVGIYQRCMIREIDDVKRATKRSQIHAAFAMRKVRRNNSVDGETQTDADAEAVLRADSVSEMLSSAFGVSPRQPGAPARELGIDSYEELLNILTASPNLQNEAQPTDSDDTAARPNLDLRLQQLGLWHDEDEEVALEGSEEPDLNQLTKHRDKILHPTDWADELQMQTELMNSILLRMSPNKRSIIERRFRDLFGAESDPPPEIMSEARRQLASLVVKALTPFYSQGRIGTRIVFKSLAKRITDRLILKHPNPDAALAKKEVKICFALKPEIVTTRDIDQLYATLGT